jgi:hypothetical protein
MKTYSAIYLVDASIRRIRFEARDLDEARRFAIAWGFGLEGEAPEEPRAVQPDATEPEAFDVADSCRILGGICRTSLYRLLVRGKLERLPETRKVLVTRRSIERYCSRAA